MFASIRKYRCRPDQVADVMRRVDEVFAPRLEQMDGFVAYDAIDTGDGTVVSFTVCRDRAACERSVALSGEFVRAELAEFDVERIDAIIGDVVVSRAFEAMLEPAHA
jgi:hypothetical protein